MLIWSCKTFSFVIMTRSIDRAISACQNSPWLLRTRRPILKPAPLHDASCCWGRQSSPLALPCRTNSSLGYWVTAAPNDNVSRSSIYKITGLLINFTHLLHFLSGYIASVYIIVYSINDMSRHMWQEENIAYIFLHEWCRHIYICIYRYDMISFLL